MAKVTDQDDPLVKLRAALERLSWAKAQVKLYQRELKDCLKALGAVDPNQVLLGEE